jgi:hypothetical protein
MTLKEKFEDFIDQKSFQKENYDAIKCEQIADDYAIEFVKWCEIKMVFSSSVIHKPTYDKLLLQFKKEKGL